MKKIVGKFQMMNQVTDGGEKVTVITGVVMGHLMTNDHKNHVLCELLVERMVSTLGDEHMSPEDFLECLDSIDWKDVLKGQEH